MDAIIQQAFFDTVEGNERLDEAELIDGNLSAHLQNDRFTITQPNPTLLATVLRSEIELTPDIREWLANLVDPNGLGTHLLAFRYRNTDELAKTLPRKKTESRDWHIGEFVEDFKKTLLLQGVAAREVRKRAINKACKQFSVSTTTVTDAMKEWAKINADLDKPFKGSSI